LGDTEKYPLGVVRCVDAVLDDYANILGNPMTMMTVNMRKRDLIETLLEDHPQAIKQLDAMGMLPKA